MISVVMPTLNAQARLAQSLEALVPAVKDGLVREVVIVDGGSRDATLDIAEGFGAKTVTAPPGRGAQLAAGARAAKGKWLFFLHADTVMEEGWADEAAAHMRDAPGSAAVFTLAFNEKKSAAKFVSTGAMLRTRLFKLPYGDQGLLISRALYDEVRGYRDLPLFEDVDLVKRIVKAGGRGALKILSSTATTSAERYERLGYARCVFRNLWLLARYHMGAPPDELAKAYR